MSRRRCETVDEEEKRVDFENGVVRYAVHCRNWKEFRPHGSSVTTVLFVDSGS